MVGSIITLGEHLERLYADAGLSDERPLTPCPPRADTVQPAAPTSSSDPQISYHGAFGAKGDFAHPFFATSLPDGGCCVADYGHSTLHVFSHDGNLTRTIALHEKLAKPLGIAIGPTNVFVSHCHTPFLAPISGAHLTRHTRTFGAHW